MKDPKVYVHASYVGTTGYNNHTRDFFRHLSKLIDIKVRNFTIGKNWDGYKDEAHNDEPWVNDIDKKLLIEQTLFNNDGSRSEYPLYKNYSNDFKHNVNLVLEESNHHYYYDHYKGPKIAYNVWEATRQQEGFFNKLLEYDEIWVPSKWQAKCTIEQGADPNKVKVVPEGVDVNTFYPEEVNHNDYDDERFKFVLFGRWDYRKSTKEIIQAFLNTFSKSDPVDLIVSIDNPAGKDLDGFETTEERLKHYGFTDDRIKIRHFPSREDYIKYLKKGHVFISCARSEGWNLPLIEAMACGTPSIYSADSAQMEFAEGKGLPVKINGQKPANSDSYAQFKYNSDVPGYFPEPDFNDLEKVMKDAYVNYKKHKKKALKDAKIIHKEFNWDNVANIGYKTLKEFLKNYKTPKDNNKILTQFYPSPKIEIKGNTSKSYEVKFIDSKKDEVIFSDIITNNMWSSLENTFDDLVIEVNGKIIDGVKKRFKSKEFYCSKLDEQERHLIDISSGALGDLIAVMPYLEAYSKKHKVKVYVKANKKFSNLFRKSYPNITITDSDNNNLFDNVIVLKHKFREPLQKYMAEQLGFEDYKYLKPKIDSFKSKRPLKSKYVAFGMHSTLQMKYWNHPSGDKVRNQSPNWNELCKMLRKNNLIPVCLELHEEFGVAPYYNKIPSRSVNKIGMSLEDVINYIEHAEFYIGLSSGMSWVAHALGKPVAMIANFTEDWNEFGLDDEKYKRITNKDVCHGCWHTENINLGDFENCPKYQNTSRQFECHTSITPKDVFNKIKEWI
jgi:autotransporter strand-loop-strand O-heptosyltransferase